MMRALVITILFSLCQALNPLPTLAKIGGGVLALVGMEEIYVRLPQRLIHGSVPSPLPDISHDVENMYILFPGFGGEDANTDRIYKNMPSTSNSFKYVYDWKKWCGNLLRASRDSEKVGKRVGKQIGEFSVHLQKKRGHSDSDDRLKKVHVIGISCGAFAANAVIEEIRRIEKKNKIKDEDRIYTKLTLLDPFTLRGIFGKDFGVNNFGKEADYCEHFLNTDDPVPSTNEPCKNAFVYDITLNEDRKTFIPLPNDNMHSYPAFFYGMNWNKFNSEMCEDGNKIHDANLPRGGVIELR